MQVFYNAVQSKAGASGLTAIVCVLLFFTAINQVTTTSRQLFAFARDGGLPFSAFLGRVSKTLIYLPSTRTNFDRCDLAWTFPSMLAL